MAVCREHFLARQARTLEPHLFAQVRENRLPGHPEVLTLPAIRGLIRCLLIQSTHSLNGRRAG